MAAATNTERTPLLAGSKAPENRDPATMSIRTRNLILGSVWMGVFLGALDTTIVSALVSSISSDFEQSNQASWLGTSYLLSTATFTPLYGRLTDIIGRRGASLTAISLFTIGTLLCGLAPSLNWLIAARAIAGLGGGGLMAVSSIVASDLVPLKKRALFQGYANVFFSLGSGSGGVIGGVVADRVGWRWAFLLQVPILVVTFVLVYLNAHYVMEGQSRSRKEMLGRIDYFGSLSLMLSLGSLVLSLSSKNNQGLPWSHPLVWIPLITFVVFTVVFVLVEIYVAKEPVLPMQLMTRRNSIFVAISNFSLSFVTFSILYFYPYVFTIVKQQSASDAGAHLAPNALFLGAGSLAAGWVIRHTGRYYWLLVISATLPPISCVLMTFLGRNSHPVLDWLSIVPTGFGTSSLLTGSLIALISSIDRSAMATATGLSYTARYSGQVVGVASSAALLQSVLTAQLEARITGPGAGEAIDRIRTVSSSIGGLPAGVREAALVSYELALRSVFWLNAGVGVVTLVACCFLVEYALPGSFEEEEAAKRVREEGSGASTPVRSGQVGTRD